MIDLFQGLVGDHFYMHQRVMDAESRAQGAESRGRELRYEFEELVERFESLLLVTASLWSLVKDQTGLTDEQLLERVQDVDLRDGRLDGKLTPHVGVCEACKRKTNGRRKTCLYCGAGLPPTSALT